MKKTLCAIALSLCAAGSANAQLDLSAADLKITELWSGVSGPDATSDWFEVTNFGSGAATGLDGNVYYDDDSFDPTKNDPLIGIDTIAPGESVVVLVSWEDDWATAQDAIDDFVTQWGAPNGNLAGVQIGYISDGSGLGSGSDAVTLFDGNLLTSEIIDGAIYPTGGLNETYVAELNGDFLTAPGNIIEAPARLAVVGQLGAYESNGLAGDDAAGHSIGSPGTVVPEPASLALIGLGLAALARRRR
ncbi:MAG: PEP-CTERM sorting domain-containing protein [Planctomycetota bacterium]